MGTYLSFDLFQGSHRRNPADLMDGGGDLVELFLVVQLEYQIDHTFIVLHRISPYMLKVDGVPAKRVEDIGQKVRSVNAHYSDARYHGSFSVADPAGADEPFWIVPPAVDAGTSGSVNCETSTDGDVSDDILAGNGIAALTEANRYTAFALDQDELFPGGIVGADRP